MNIIKVEDFNIANYSTQPISDYGNDFPQHIAFPSYKYPNGQSDACLILTNPIKIAVEGLPRIHPQWRPNDNDCLDFWLYLDTDPGAIELKQKVLEQIDAHYTQKINQQGNTNYIVKNNNGQLVPIQKLKYSNSIKQVIPIGNGEDDDYEKKYTEKKYGGNTNRVKISIDTAYVPGANHHDPKLIKTAIFIPVNTKVPIKDREFKSTPEPINCLDDIRKYYNYGCTVQFVLKIYKVWTMKNLQMGKRDCGIKIKCLQMFILDNPAWNIVPKFTNNIIPQGLGIKVANSVSSVPTQKTQHVQPLQQAQLNAYNDVHNYNLSETDSDSETDSESEEELLPAMPKKGNSKQLTMKK